MHACFFFLVVPMILSFHPPREDKQDLTFPAKKTSAILFRFFIFWNGTYAAWMIMLLSVERFAAIFFPIRSRTWTTRRRVILIVLSVGFALGLLNLHHLWTYDLKLVSRRLFCGTVEKYSTFLSVYWPWINLTVYSIIPLTTMIATSIAIIAKLLHNRAVRSRNLKKSDGDGGRMTSITLTLLSVCLAFVLTNGPITVDR